MLTKLFTLENGNLMTKAKKLNMEMVKLYSQEQQTLLEIKLEEKNMMGSGKTTKCMDMVLTALHLEINIQVNGFMESCRVKVK